MTGGSFRFGKPNFKALFDIRARLILLALILVVPLMLDRVRTLEDNRNRQISAATSNLLNVARRGADAQREMLKQVQGMLRTAAAVYTHASRLGQPCGMLNSGLKVQIEGIGNISIANSDGRLICSSNPRVVGIDISDRPYFHQALREKRFVLSDYVITRSDAQPSVIAAFPTPVTDENDAGGIVMTTVTLSWLEHLLDRFPSQAGLTVTLVDSTGTVLAAKPMRPGSATARAMIEKVVSSGKAELTGEILFDRESGRLTFASVRVPDTSARLIVSIDERTLLGTIDSEIRSASIQLALVGILVLLGAWYMSERLIIRPIRLLTNTTARFGAGDFSARSSRNNLPPEFMPLAQAFDRMASQLAERERELINTNDRLAVLASLDSLSGLANRRGFDSRLNFEWLKAIQSEGKVALAMLDIDHFKLFNDTYGHPEGDAALAKVGEVIGAVAARIGGFAARYGGEEFALLLPAASSAQAAEMGEMIRAAVEALDLPHRGSMHGHVTVSVGVAVMTPSSEQQDPRVLVEAADAGLYAAKRRGRNTVVEHGAIRAVDQAMALAG